jgi:hypothetical protein
MKSLPSNLSLCFYFSVAVSVPSLFFRQRESAQLNAVLNNAQFQLDPLAAIHQHLVSTQSPSSVKDGDSAKNGKKSRKDKKRKKKKKNALSTPQSMDI